MAKTPSQRKLDELRREWQKILRLQDWKISSKFVSAKELTDGLGECEHLATAKTAKILILNPSEMDHAAEGIRGDPEDTLVHEMLHCHFSPFQSANKAVKLQQEQAIEAIAGALVGLKRRKP